MANKFSTVGIKAGDTIYIAEMGSWHMRISARTCTSVTPTGRVVLEFGTNNEFKYTFGPDGEEITSSRSRKRLVTKERYDAWVAENDREAKIRDIRSRVTEASKLPLSEMATVLAGLKAEVDALTA